MSALNSRLTAIRSAWPGLLAGGLLLVAAVLYTMELTHTQAVKMHPGQWVGQTWPAPGAIEASADFRAGRWVVLLYSAGCGRCRATADDYADLAQLWRSEGREVGVALISTDPKTAPLSMPGVETGRFYVAQPYGKPPVVLVVVDGKIVAVHEGRNQVDWSAPPFASWLGR